MCMQSEPWLTRATLQDMWLNGTVQDECIVLQLMLFGFCFSDEICIYPSKKQNIMFASQAITLFFNSLWKLVEEVVPLLRQSLKTVKMERETDAPGETATVVVRVDVDTTNPGNC